MLSDCPEDPVFYSTQRHHEEDNTQNLSPTALKTLYLSCTGKPPSHSHAECSLGISGWDKALEPHVWPQLLSAGRGNCCGTVREARSHTILHFAAYLRFPNIIMVTDWMLMISLTYSNMKGKLRLKTSDARNCQDNIKSECWGKSFGNVLTFMPHSDNMIRTR
jgi:hypothetical protein